MMGVFAIAGLVGLLLGLVGAGAGVYFMLYAAGFFDYLGGKRCRPDAVGRHVLYDRLLALNDQAKPYSIHEGGGTDLIAEWKIVDASWYGILSKSQLSKAYRARLLLDEARHSVRCYEELGSIDWTAGTDGLTPIVHYRSSFFGGRILFKKEYAVGYGLKKPSPLEAGQVYNYKFDVDEIRGPIIAEVNDVGWEWVPVTAKRNATYQAQSSGTDVTPMPSGFCRYCGNKVNVSDTFCPHCGKKTA